MKKNKFLKSFAVVLIAVICLTLFSVVVSADGNVYFGDVGGSEYGGSAHTQIVVWKVSLYVAPVGTAKTDDKSNFVKKSTVLYCNSSGKGMAGNGNEYEYQRYQRWNLYVCSGDKIGYLKGETCNGTKRFGNFRTVVSPSVPVIKIGENKSAYENSVRSYFDTYGADRVREIDGSVDIDSPWALIVEPLLFVQNHSSIYNSWLYSATEYAIAQESGGYSSIKGLTTSYTLSKLPEIICLEKGNWLGIGNESFSHSWTYYDVFVRNRNMTYDQFNACKNDIKRYGGCGIFFSHGFDLPNFTVNKVTSNYYRPVENTEVTISATVTSTIQNALYSKVECVLYADNREIAKTNADFSGSKTCTVTFAPYNVGSCDSRIRMKNITFKVVINPKSNPKELNYNDNSGKTTVTVVSPVFNGKWDPENLYVWEDGLIYANLILTIDNDTEPDSKYSFNEDFIISFNNTMGEIEKEVTIKRANGKEEKQNAKLYSSSGVLNAKIQLKISDEDGGKITVTYKIHVGKYTNENYQKTVTGGFESSKRLQVGILNIFLKRDFAVDGLKINNNEQKISVFENSIVSVSFKASNKNPYLGYNNVPIAVYVEDENKVVTKVAEAKINLSANGQSGSERSCTVNVNIGTIKNVNKDLNYKVYAVINSSDYKASMYGEIHELSKLENKNDGKTYNYMSNNKTPVSDNGNIRVKRIIDLSVSVVSSANQYPNCARSVYPGGNTTAYAVTSCIVGNHSRFNLYSDDAMNDTITVHFLVNGSERGKKTVNIPAKGTNLVYFKWAVPSNPGKVTLTAYIEWNVNEEYHPDRNDNRADLNGEIIKVDYHKTADTSLKTKKSDSYSGANAYKKLSPYVARWSQWVYVGGGSFEKVDYALSTENETKLYPMNSENGELSFASGSTIAAGSAFALNYKYNIVTETYGSRGGKYSVPDDAYTFEQNAVASFPEFNYKTVSDCRTLYLSNQGKDLRACNFEFDANASADGNQKVHFTPINMPNGTYKVGILGKDIWTPAGMIYANSSAALNIGGSIYNDFYVS